LPLAEIRRVLVNKVLYDLRDIRRGEIVVFHGEGSWGANAEAPPAPPGNPLEGLLRGAARAVGAAPPGDKDYVKRVIGVPGDRVACCTPDGSITVQPAGTDRPGRAVRGRRRQSAVLRRRHRKRHLPARR